MQTYKRRNYFIDKGAQSRFIFAFAASSLLGGVVGVLCFIFFARQKIEATLYSMRLPEIAVGDLLLREMFLTMAITLLFVLILFVWIAGKVFRRINDPLEKMSGVVGQIIGGDLRGEIKLREDDEFQNLAGDLDSFLGNLRGSFASIRNCADLVQDISKNVTDEIEYREQLQENLAELKKNISTFTL